MNYDQAQRDYDTAMIQRDFPAARAAFKLMVELRPTDALRSYLEYEFAKLERQRKIAAWIPTREWLPKWSWLTRGRVRA